MRSPNVYVSANWKYGATSDGLTYMNCGFGGGQPTAPAWQPKPTRSAPSIFPPSYIFTKAVCAWLRSKLFARVIGCEVIVYPSEFTPLAAISALGSSST